MTRFPALKNDLILRAARGETTERAPVWVMRQAGRYLPEFRAVRAESDFFNVCRTPEKATEVTVQPIRRYSGLLDAAIIFSDILVLPQALGLVVEMVPGKGPHFPSPLADPAVDLQRLNWTPDIDQELKYVYDAITMTRLALNGEVPLIGFCGAPWTLLAYMIEGGGSKTHSKSKTWLLRHPQESHRILRLLSDSAVTFLVGQVRAGAQLLQVFESNAGELNKEMFEEFSLPYLRDIAKQTKARLAAEGLPTVPITVFARNAQHAYPELSRTEYDVVSVDWLTEPSLAANGLETPKVLQGNLDPITLFAPHDVLRTKTREMVRKFYDQIKAGKIKSYIANMGHGMMPDHDPEALRVFLETVHEETKALAAQA
ncbi:uroporphyrinogen decarboxylase-like protein [Ramicandelaber brevisporus]|nr:uroporphyrinogen decarboxylase-like protein [Ramicandelaber brevisporus]